MTGRETARLRIMEGETLLKMTEWETAFLTLTGEELYLRIAGENGASRANGSANMP